MTEIQFSIRGMHCIGCQQIIEEKLKKTDGIRQVSVSYETGRASVTFDPYPIFAENKSESPETISISYDFLKQSASIFANWKIG